MPIGDRITGDGLYGDSIELVTLSIDNLIHAHQIQAAPLTQHNILDAPANLAHGHTITGDLELGSLNFVLTGVAKLTHAHQIQTVGLTQHNVLDPADLMHSQTIESVALNNVPTLIIDNLAHAQTIQTADITTHAILIIPENLRHGHTIGTVSLTVSLQVDDLTHGHTIGEANLTAHYTLAVDSLMHSQTIESVPFGGWQESSDFAPHGAWAPIDERSTALWEDLALV